MMTMSRRLALLLASGTLLASCGAPDEGAERPTTDPPVAEETTVDPTPSPSGAPAPRDVVRAVDDLAASLGVDAGEVEVVSVEEVTWRDGSRGCAEPGMAYTQALVDGSRITLRAAGRTYEYHSGGSRPPARCDEPTQ
jgi:hypothetical protein